MRKRNMYVLGEDSVVYGLDKKGKIFCFSLEDFGLVSKYRWSVNSKGYVIGSNGEVVTLHRLIAKARPDEVVDHINGNTSDNRRSNLRTCDDRENLSNSGMRTNNTSGYKGVVRVKSGYYKAQISKNYKRYNLGELFETPEAAAAAYDRAALLLHGEFARTNAMLGLLPNAVG